MASAMAMVGEVPQQIVSISLSLLKNLPSYERHSLYATEYNVLIAVRASLLALTM